MHDTFFEEIDSEGRHMYCRETNLLRKGPRTLNIVDEVEVEEKKNQIEEEKKGQEDMSYEDYVKMFADHIEGKAEPREIVDSDDEVASKQSPSKKGGATVKPTTPKKEEDKSKKEDSKSRNEYGSEATNSMNKTGTSFNKEEAKENLKYTIPETCYIKIAKKLKIEKLDAKYNLCSHPFPLVEGEMILFQPKKEDQTQKLYDITYRDYSLCKRLETSVKPVTAASLSKKKDRK